MKIKRFTSALCTAWLTLSAFAAQGDPVSIPTPTGEYFDWNSVTIAGSGSVEVGGSAIGSTGSNTVATFNLRSEAPHSYELTLATGHKGHAWLDIAIEDAGGTNVFTATHEIVNTKSWTPTYESTFRTAELPAGDYKLILKSRDLTDSNYAGNWGKLALYDASIDNTEHIPGTVTIANASMIGGARNEGENIGYIKDGCGSSNKITVDEAGVYSMTFDMARYGDGTVEVTVTDDKDNVEARTLWPIPSQSWNGYKPQTVNIEGELTPGVKTLSVVFHATHNSFIANYKDMKFDKFADHCAIFNGVSIAGQSVTAGEGYDWNCNLPMTFNDAEVTVKAVANDRAIVTATAVDGNGGNVTVTAGGNGTFTLPTPAPGTETLVTFNVSAAEGVHVFRSSYTLRLYHIGDILVRTLTIDGAAAPADLIEALNARGNEVTASLNDWIFTAEPVITATFADNSTVRATGTVENGIGIYTFEGKAGSVTKKYTISVGGIHLYTAASEDELVKLTFDPALVSDNVWDNGLYSINPGGSGWGGKQFKFKTNTEVTLSVPSNVIVRRIKFAGLRDNYKPGSIGYVTSEGATVYLPTVTAFVTGEDMEKDLYVNFENHKAGTPVKFLFDNGSEPVAMFEILVQKEIPATAPVLMKTEVTPTVNVNHAVVAMNFDREMKAAEATVAGQTVAAEVNGATVRFKIWDLPFDATSELVIAAGNAEDVYGNLSADEIKVPIEVGSPAAVAAIEPIVVSNVAEWKEALRTVAASNRTADAPRAVIFVRNGDYDFGGEEQNLGKTYNVSVIGESREGTVLHGNRTGISNPVVSTRQATGTYFQDLTIRNDLDFGKENRVGVGTAFYGGAKDVMHNVALQSVQDTYVTGEQSYLDGCYIHGSVDYICGGGDHYFDNCQLVHEVEGGYITAPSTSAGNRYGYVFESCTVSGEGGYFLGRPWQNEPRAYFINTVLESDGNPDGWGSMGSLPTHFYEYNSIDGKGNPVDLSVRKNSPTSTNSYSPVLTAEEAAQLTIRTVLGGNDSWDAAEATVQCKAPEGLAAADDKLSWNADKDASGYAVFADGRYLGHTVTNSYQLPAARAAVTYSVRAANAMGGLGATAVLNTDPTGVAESGVAADESTELYNLQGVRVDASAKGVLIRVTTAADGSRRAEKIIVK